MVWWIILIETIVFTGFFTALVLLPTIKHPEIGVHNYPKEIQEEYFKTHEMVDTKHLSLRTIIFKVFGIILFTAILIAGAILAGAKTFWDGVIFATILVGVVGAWDTFFIDWVLFANLRCFRLSGTEHIDKEYHQKWFHVKGMLFPGLLFLVIIASLTGLIIHLIF